MPEVRISYRDALAGLMQAEEVEHVVRLLDEHKNWGAFSARLPSYILVNLIDALRSAREQLASYSQVEPIWDDEDLPDELDEDTTDE